MHFSCFISHPSNLGLHLEITRDSKLNGMTPPALLSKSQIKISFELPPLLPAYWSSFAFRVCRLKGKFGRKEKSRKLPRAQYLISQQKRPGAAERLHHKERTQLRSYQNPTDFQKI